MNKAIINAMTIDVEDYFHVSAFENVIDPSDWATMTLCVERNTERLLEIYDKANVKCTFFVLGWVAEQCPSLIRNIAAQGHEIASHGYAHRRATEMSRQQFKEDVVKSKHLLEDLIGEHIIGYRAPSFSVNDSNTWVFEVLVELGFKYSSSTYPVEHDLYGVPEWPRFAYQRQEGILEIPVPTLRRQGRNIGIGGGGYFRLYPYWFSKKRIDKYHLQEQQPYSFYFHPWEIDTQQPRIKGASLKSKFRHYVNIATMEGKIENLLRDYQWATMQEVYSRYLK